MPLILTERENVVRDQTFKVAMLRAAEVIERITLDDVLEMQAQLLAEGVSLEQVAKLDRASVAVAHLRAFAGVKGKR